MAKTTTATNAKTDDQTKPATKAKKPTVAKQNSAVKALLELSGGDVVGTVSQHVENLTSAKALELLPKLFDRVDNTFFTIGGILARVHEEQWWKDAGHESFKDCVTEEYGIDYRTAMYWVQIYNDLVAAEINFEEVSHIGWSKLKEISNVINQENKDEWVKRAEEMSLRQLLEYIKAIKAGGSADDKGGDGVDPNQSEVKSYTFKLHEDERAAVSGAVESAMEQLGTEFPSVAITHICDTYLAGDGTGATKGASLEDQMKEADYTKTLEIFEKVFPNIDLEVTVNS